MILLHSWIFEFIMYVIFFILVVVTYSNIDNNAKVSFDSMDYKIIKNIIVWVLIVVFIMYNFYKKGQVDAFNDKINFKQEIIKKYDKRTGDLIKQDTIYTYIKNKKE